MSNEFFHSMSEKRRVLFELNAKTDEELSALLDHRHPGVAQAAKVILAERYAVRKSTDKETNHGR